ncbi:MAG TPA: hypothetical protein VGL58_16515 [Caulobacteraceae bacterium]|jgi:hypothetical protein
MSNVRFEFPKLRLAQQLKEAGGLAVADAVEAASANLAELRPACLTELQRATQEAQDCFNGFGKTYSEASLKALYAICARAVGVGAVCGAPQADGALVSLCDLVDRMMNLERCDREPIAVHIQTLQILAFRAAQGDDAAKAEDVLAGLRKVSARYLNPPPRAASA